MNLLEQPEQLLEPELNQELPKEEPTPKSNIKVPIIIASLVAIVLIVLITFYTQNTPEIRTVCFSSNCISGIVEDEYQWNGFQFYSIGGLWYTQILKRIEAVTS